MAEQGPGPNNPTGEDDAVLADRLVRLHGEDHAPTRQQWLELLGDPDRGPVLVVYQVAFRDEAVGPDGELDGRTGKQAFLDAGAAILPAVLEVRGVPVLGAEVRATAGAPTDEAWDYLGGARYPDRRALVRLWLDDRFVAAESDRAAGTERHRLWFTSPLW